MVYYIFPIVILLLGTPNLTHVAKIKIFKFSLLMLFFFCALRGNGNGDYFTYIEYSRAIIAVNDVMNFSFPMEIGFRLISFLGNSLGLHQQFIIIFMAVISVGLVYKVVDKYSLDKNLSLVVYFPIFLMMDMHASRTAISAGFGLLAILFFIEKRKILTTICFILSLSFHMSAIILVFSFLTTLPLYILFFLLISTIIFSISIGVVGLASIFVDWISNPLLTYKFYNYISNEEYTYGLPIYDPRIIWPIMVSLLMLSFIKNIVDKTLRDLFKFYIVGTIIFIFFSDLAIFAVRLSHFYMITSLIVIPGLCTYIDKHYRFVYGDTRIFLSKWVAVFYYTTISALILFFGYVEYKVFI